MSLKDGSSHFSGGHGKGEGKEKKNTYKNGHAKAVYGFWECLYNGVCAGAVPCTCGMYWLYGKICVCRNKLCFLCVFVCRCGIMFVLTEAVAAITPG